LRGAGEGSLFLHGELRDAGEGSLFLHGELRGVREGLFFLTENSATLERVSFPSRRTPRRWRGSLFLHGELRDAGYTSSRGLLCILLSAHPSGLLLSLLVAPALRYACTGLSVRLRPSGTFSNTLTTFLRWRAAIHSLTWYLYIPFRTSHDITIVLSQRECPYKLTYQPLLSAPFG